MAPFPALALGLTRAGVEQGALKPQSFTRHALDSYVIPSMHDEQECGYAYSLDGPSSDISFGDLEVRGDIKEAGIQMVTTASVRASLALHADAYVCVGPLTTEEQVCSASHPTLVEFPVRVTTMFTATSVDDDTAVAAAVFTADTTVDPISESDLRWSGCNDFGELESLVSGYIAEALADGINAAAEEQAEAMSSTGAVAKRQVLLNGTLPDGSADYNITVLLHAESKFEPSTLLYAVATADAAFVEYSDGRAPVYYVPAEPLEPLPVDLPDYTDTGSVLLQRLEISQWLIEAGLDLASVAGLGNVTQSYTVIDADFLVQTRLKFGAARVTSDNRVAVNVTEGGFTASCRTASGNYSTLIDAYALDSYVEFISTDDGTGVNQICLLPRAFFAGQVIVDTFNVALPAPVTGVTNDVANAYIGNMEPVCLQMPAPVLPNSRASIVYADGGPRVQLEASCTCGVDCAAGMELCAEARLLGGVDPSYDDDDDVYTFGGGDDDDDDDSDTNGRWLGPTARVVFVIAALGIAVAGLVFHPVAFSYARALQCLLLLALMVMMCVTDSDVFLIWSARVGRWTTWFSEATGARLDVSPLVAVLGRMSDVEFVRAFCVLLARVFVDDPVLVSAGAMVTNFVLVYTPWLSIEVSSLMTYELTGGWTDHVVPYVPDLLQPTLVFAVQGALWASLTPVVLALALLSDGITAIALCLQLLLALMIGPGIAVNFNLFQDLTTSWALWAAAPVFLGLCGVLVASVLPAPHAHRARVVAAAAAAAAFVVALIQHDTTTQQTGMWYWAVFGVSQALQVASLLPWLVGVVRRAEAAAAAADDGDDDDDDEEEEAPARPTPIPLSAVFGVGALVLLGLLAITEAKSGVPFIVAGALVGVMAGLRALASGPTAAQVVAAMQTTGALLSVAVAVAFAVAGRWLFAGGLIAVAAVALVATRYPLPVGALGFVGAECALFATDHAELGAFALLAAAGSGAVWLANAKRGDKPWIDAGLTVLESARGMPRAKLRCAVLLATGAGMLWLAATKELPSLSPAEYLDEQYPGGVSDDIAWPDFVIQLARVVHDLAAEERDWTLVCSVALFVAAALDAAQRAKTSIVVSNAALLAVGFVGIRTAFVDFYDAVSLDDAMPECAGDEFTSVVKEVYELITSGYTAADLVSVLTGLFFLGPSAMLRTGKYMPVAIQTAPLVMVAVGAVTIPAALVPPSVYVVQASDSSPFTAVMPLVACASMSTLLAGCVAFGVFAPFGKEYDVAYQAYVVSFVVYFLSVMYTVTGTLDDLLELETYVRMAVEGGATTLVVSDLMSVFAVASAAPLPRGRASAVVVPLASGAMPVGGEELA